MLTVCLHKLCAKGSFANAFRKVEKCVNIVPEGQKQVAETTGGFLWSYRASNVYLVYFNSKGLLFIR